jgi:hypothetical protein
MAMKNKGKKKVLKGPPNQHPKVENTRFQRTYCTKWGNSEQRERGGIYEF